MRLLNAFPRYVLLRDPFKGVPNTRYLESLNAHFISKTTRSLAKYRFLVSGHGVILLKAIPSEIIS